MSTATDAPLADSSTAAPDAPPPLPTLASMTSAERAQWRVTGESPARSVSSDAAADSSPALAGDQPVSTETSTPAASEPAKGKGVKARSAELDAEIAEMRDRLKTRALLREELARLDSPKPDASAAPSPAPSHPPVTDLGRPMLTEAEFFAAYPDAAYGQYSVYATRYVVAEDHQQREQQAQQAQRQTEWNTSVAAVRAEHPDYDVLVDNFKQLPDTLANRALGAAIQEKRNARLYYHLMSHPEETQRLARLSPTEALMELGKLDAQIGHPSAPATSLLKTRTDAPPPPPSITQRASAPANDLDGALAAGDVRRYKELANARDIAARK